MSDKSPSSILSGDTDSGTVPTTTATTRWAPHGRVLTACLVAVNVALVFLVYLYFWRVFSRKRAASSSSASARGGGDDNSDASSSASAPSSPPRIQDGGERDRVVASLPTFVHSGGAAGGKAAADCAVCIAELKDGDEGRALPRCGHRFHAACVDVWLRLHTTCPLCRASVVVPAPEAERKGGVPGTTAAVEDMDARSSHYCVSDSGVYEAKKLGHHVSIFRHQRWSSQHLFLWITTPIQQVGEA